MSHGLDVSVGQCTQAGKKASNEDCCGIRVPDDALLDYKGIVAVVADGVGSSSAGREASEYCVQGFLTDYYSTPDSLSVQTSGERVINSLNSWLYGRSQRSESTGLALASTMSALVLKSRTAHLFHIGDSRIHLIRGNTIRRLTKDHRLRSGPEKSYLTRAMGAELYVQLDYDSIAVEAGDVFVLATDGVHESITQDKILDIALASTDSPETAAMNIVESALEAGSEDNLTCQVLRVLQLPNEDENEFYRELTQLSFPPDLEPGSNLDGYRIIRTLHLSPTVQVYLAIDTRTEETVVVKTPSANFADDPTYIDRFVHEQWVGRRIDNAHVLRVRHADREHSYLYYVTDYIEGKSLAQWILDNPTPDLGQVRDIASQTVNGLRAFHRLEMVHRDIKPENIMIDKHGEVRIIDFGCTLIAGLKETYTPIEQYQYVGTPNYIAPELFEGFEGTPKSDMYSLGVTLYEMLSGEHFPYGDLSRTAARKHLDYISVRKFYSAVPVWMDRTIQKAVSRDPDRRYESLSEFLYDLSNPNPEFMKSSEPLLEKNPVAFWKGASIILLLVTLFLIFLLTRK